MRVGVVGLGRLGLPMASLFSRYHETLGYDTNRELLDLIADGRFKTREPDVDYSDIRLAYEIDTLVANTDIAVICVNTPTTRQGTMDLTQVHQSTAAIQWALPKGKPYTVVICSTVMPGTTAEIAKNFTPNLFVSPVWIAMGSVIADLQRPPALVLGYTEMNQGNRDAFELATNLWMPFANAQIMVTDSTTAEFCKLYHNYHCTLKMAEIGYIRDNLPEINVEMVSWFMRSGGERPGKFWLPGPPFSGDCFPRDLEFFAQYSKLPMAKEVARENALQYQRIANEVTWGSNVLILGRAYKHGVDYESASFSFKMAEHLKARGCNVYIEDAIPSGVNFDYCILHHAELREQTEALPDECKIIDLWKVGA